MANIGECYLCGGAEFNKRPGNVRDNPSLEVLECASCGLVFLSSFDHITHLIDKIKENGGQIGVYPVSEKAWIDVGQWAEYRKALKVIEDI